MKNSKLIMEWFAICALFLGFTIMDGILLPLIISSNIFPLAIIIIVGGIAIAFSIAFSFALIIAIAHRIAIILNKGE
jgi:hypothetical protein